MTFKNCALKYHDISCQYDPGCYLLGPLSKPERSSE